jgi:hypothetical protein
VATKPPPATSTVGERYLLRHALATIAYRASRVVLDPPAGYADFRAGPTTRTPRQIVAHIGDLMDWALSHVRGAHAWHMSTPLPWNDEVNRMFSAIERLDAFLASDTPLGWPPDRLIQAPIADTFTHIGQLAMLRRLAGAPVRGEHFGEADIAVGRVGLDQPRPRFEID